MSEKPSQHVVPSIEGNWAVRKSGSKKATKTFEKQSEAIDYAKKISRKQGAALYIHKRNGLIQEKLLPRK